MTWLVTEVVEDQFRRPYTLLPTTAQDAFQNIQMQHPPTISEF